MFDEMHFKKKYKDFFSFKVASRTISNPPKIPKILENLEKSKGPALIYSQFRESLGVSIVATALRNIGYAEVKIHKANKEMHIKTDDEKAKKHFIIFSNTNPQRMQLLMDIFNKNVANLPQSIVKDMKGLTIDVIFITQAGSEGISLKGVRQVHLMEPYWNYVRISQVIGRAVRAKSHLHLDKKDQDVEVFMYTTVLTEAQKEVMVWDNGKLSIEGLSSDEMVLFLARRKEAILGKLLTIMKETSIDCKVHLSKHLLMNPDMKCV